MGKELKATFAFLVTPKEEEKRLDANAIARLVEAALNVAHMQHCFNRFFLYLELQGERELSIGSQLTIAGHEGTVSQMSLRSIHTHLEGKLVEEDKARQIKGHESYTPKSILTSDTCVMAFGQREFCAAVASAHMYEIVPLRLKLVDMLIKICGLEPYRKQCRETDHLFLASVRPDDRGELTYNINWWADKSQEPRIARDPMELIARRDKG